MKKQEEQVDSMLVKIFGLKGEKLKESRYAYSDELDSFCICDIQKKPVLLDFGNGKQVLITKWVTLW